MISPHDLERRLDALDNCAPEDGPPNPADRPTALFEVDKRDDDADPAEPPEHLETEFVVVEPEGKGEP